MSTSGTGSGSGYRAPSPCPTEGAAPWGGLSDSQVFPLTTWPKVTLDSFGVSAFVIGDESRFFSHSSNLEFQKQRAAIF